MITKYAPRHGTKFAVGKRGSWFVDVRNGEYLPCLHKEFWTVGNGGNLYHQAAYYDPNKVKMAKYVEALRQGRAVMTYSEAAPGKGTFAKGRVKRVGYIEGRIFKITDVVNDPVSGLTLRVIGSEMA